MRPPLRAATAVPLIASALLALTALAAPAAAQVSGIASPDTLSVSFYVDSAAAVRALAALPAPEGSRGFTLFALSFDDAGVADTVLAVTDEHLTGLTAAVTPLLRAHARRQVPSRDPAGAGAAPVRRRRGGGEPLGEPRRLPQRDFARGITLRVVTGPDAEIGLARLQWPELSNGWDFRRLLSAISQSQRKAVGRGASITLRFRVFANGAVDPESVSVFSSTGHPEVDRLTAEVARQIRFRPGVAEGVRVNVWVLLPILLQRPDR